MINFFLTKKIILIFALLVTLSIFIYLGLFSRFLLKLISNKEPLIVITNSLNHTKVTLSTTDTYKQLFGMEVFENGIFSRDIKYLDVKNVNEPKLVVINFTFSELPRDKIFVDNVVISSTKERFITDYILYINFGYNKEYYESLTLDKKQKLLGLTFLSTLYRISHPEFLYPNRERELMLILKKVIDSKKVFFRIYEN